ncbi:tubulin delta chain-like isoform X1 [Achlya hypogyna]|uniref:Tubulin delta chain-like isoform X1 n=1 Tax=Achlya hypogyna TaxID=1202772 RepID=A0A1V9Z8K8_ACHHY|nr:tubulin delta chain-like isoform X1 [Achlya hypogyna]
MSITVCVGQCGNQVGAEILALTPSSTGEDHRPYILVDSEPKVVRSISARVAGVHVEQSGRGNNWAMGYHQRTNVALTELVLESLRKEIEVVDCYRGAVLMHSLAGGTGAGLGCRLLEAIRDRYPKAYILNGCIAPSLRGDTPLQNYNALFTLRHLQTYSDAVLFKDNDDLTRLVGHWRSGSAGVTLDDMNKLVAADWAGLLLPSTTNRTRAFDPGTFVTQVCPLSSIKFVDVRTAYVMKKPPRGRHPFVAVATSTDLDTSLVDATKQLLVSYPYAVMQATSIGRHMSVRGCRDTEVAKAVARVVAKSLPPPDFLSGDISTTLSTEAPVSATSGSVTLCSNGQTNAIPLIQTFIERAAKQLHAKAYLHWYRKYGVVEADFEDSLDACLGIVDEYKAWTE